MKKLNLWLLLSLFAAAFTLSACGSDDDDDNSTPPTASLAGTVWYETDNSDPANDMYMTWAFANGQLNWGNLMKNAQENSWTKFTRHSFSLTVTGNAFTLTNAEEVKMSGSYVINGDVMTLTLDESKFNLTRIKGDLLDKWNSASEIDIYSN